MDYENAYDAYLPPFLGIPRLGSLVECGPAESESVPRASV